jgi:hypothetical protein
MNGARASLARGITLALAMATSACLASSALAATKIEGEYDWMMEMRKDFRAFPWQFNSNDGSVYSPLQLHMFSQPSPGVETWVKVEADYDQSNNPSPTPEFHYSEAHMRFRRDLGGRGFDTYLFSRQDRFWSDTYLIPYVYGIGDGQGVRVETWGFLHTNATFVFADESGANDPNYLSHRSPYDWSPFGTASGNFPSLLAPVDSLNAKGALRTNDRYVARLKREFFKDRRLRMGMTFNRYETWTGSDSVSGAGTPKTVLGFDSRYRLAGADVAFEYGQSFNKTGRVGVSPVTFFRDPLGINMPRNAVMQGEIRSIKLGTQRLGYLGITPGWWQRGADWSNGLGGPGSDETGFNVQSYYLLPERAITYSNQLLWYGNKVNSRNKTREIYNELYIEFLNGFTGKTYYRRRDEYSTSNGRPVRATHLTWFNEVQVESKLGWLRLQSKAQDIGNAQAKQLFAVEQRLNLTSKTKIYNRFALGNDPSILRKGLFTQLQYRPSGNVEMYLQYGPDNIGSGSTPVDDGNLAGSGDQYDSVKFILKGSF